jgi:hypothetical protein
MKAESDKTDATGPTSCMVTTLRPGERVAFDVPGETADRRIVVMAVWPEAASDRRAAIDAVLMPGRN